MFSLKANPIVVFTFCMLFLTIVLNFSVAAGEIDRVHQWNQQQQRQLKSLWIESLPLALDSSNRAVNNPTAVKLGHRLFFDTRFSANGKIACASCHHPERYFTDGLETAKGIAKVNRNAPSIVGSSHNTWFFHDGRSDSLWSQALGPLENEKEQGGNRNQFAHLVYNDPTLREKYEIVFGSMPNISNLKRFPAQAGPVKNKAANSAWNEMSALDQRIITEIFVNIGKSIAAYETKLQPAASKFDLYVKAVLNNELEKMKKLYTADEAIGLRIFISDTNCTICHSGPLLTDKGFHNISVPPRKLGEYDWGRYIGAQQVVKSPFNCRSSYNDAPPRDQQKPCDELKYMVMARHETSGAMKTPSLRNVAKTAPYMHAGQYKTLHKVIQHYNDPPQSLIRQSELFLKVNLNEQEMNQLVIFLKSLNSPIDTQAELLVAP